MPHSSNTQITLSYNSIFRVVWVLVLLFFVYIIRDALALLFVSIIFAAAVDPWVDWLQIKKIPRAVSVLFIYLVLLAVLSLVIVMMIPPITEQIGQLVSSFPQYYEKISIGINSLKDQASDSATAIGNNSIVTALQSLTQTLAQTTKSIFVTITGIFGGFMSLLVVLVMTFYLVVEENALKKFVKFVTPYKYRSYTMSLIERMELKIGLWLRGQLVLCLVVGILVYFLLLIFGVKYALLLALIAGILEIIPYLGPWLSAIPAVIVASSDSFIKVIIVIAIYLFVQQIENSIIVPRVMHKIVGLNPIIVIMSILIGVKLGGVVGGLLGVPVAAAISVYFSDIMKEKKSLTAPVK